MSSQQLSSSSRSNWDLIPWRFRGQLQWRRGISCREQEDQRSGIIWSSSSSRMECTWSTARWWGSRRRRRRPGSSSSSCSCWRRGRPAAAAARRRRSGHPGRSPRSAAPAAPSRSGSDRSIDRSMMIFLFFLWDRRVSTWCLSMLTCCLLWCLSAWFRALAVGCSTPDVHVIPLSCLCCKISVIEFTYLAYILAKQSLDVFVRWFLIWSFSGPPLFSNSVQIVHELVQTSDCKVSLCHHSLQSTSSSIVNSHRKTKY